MHSFKVKELRKTRHIECSQGCVHNTMIMTSHFSAPHKIQRHRNELAENYEIYQQLQQQLREELKAVVTSIKIQ